MVITIGNFDGVHLGHRELINKTISIAEDKKIMSTIMTFSPHPRTFFQDKAFYLLNNTEEKKRIFDSLQVDNKIFMTFDKSFSSLLPYEFVDLLKEKFNCRHIVIGENYTFGKDKQGNVALLKKLCHEKSIDITVAPSVYKHGVVVSSKYIRELVLEGDVKTAAEFLTEPYFIMGNVIEGNKIGRTLGFPTVNLGFAPDKLLPKNGVYFTKALVNEREYNSITNIGVRPTVNGKSRAIETYIFDFEKEVYGENVLVKFLCWHRDEAKFDSLSDLSKQISNDKDAAIDYFR